jgi:hypothetical protein
MAREILVEGHNPAAVGAAHGVSRQAARRAADRILAELKGKDIPENWQTVTVVGPLRDRESHPLSGKLGARPGGPQTFPRGGVLYPP